MASSPTSQPRSARLELLSRLLLAHERSKSYGRPGPWPRDVVLRLTPGQFPAAFAPDGREELAALKAAAAALEEAGAIRVVRHRGLAAGELRELRLGAAELPRAYDCAIALGFEPLVVGLRAVADHASRLLVGADNTHDESAPPPEWMLQYLERLSGLERSADPSPLGRQREAFKQQWREILPALTAAAALSRGVSGWERVISERVLGHSKRMGELRPLIALLLARADPQWDGVDLRDTDILESYGVRRKPGLIRCAGQARLKVGSSTYLLDDFTPTAHLPGAWSAAWIEGLAASGVRLVTTIENEYPFLSYVEHAGGPRALGARKEVAVYVAGFPTPDLIATLTELARIDGVQFRHWGDADVGGLRIWWNLRRSVCRPVGLFRTTAEWVEQEAARGGAALTSVELRALRRLRAQIAATSRGDETDVQDALRLIDALARLGVRFEQERESSSW